MMKLILGLFFLIRGAIYMLKSSYYHLIKESLVGVSMQIVSKQRISSKRGFRYTYRYEWKNEERYFLYDSRTIKGVGDYDLFYVDPRFNIVFEEENRLNYFSFFGLMMFIFGLVNVIQVFIS